MTITILMTLIPAASFLPLSSLSHPFPLILSVSVDLFCCSRESFPSLACRRFCYIIFFSTHTRKNICSLSRDENRCKLRSTLYSLHSLATWLFFLDSVVLLLLLKHFYFCCFNRFIFLSFLSILCFWHFLFYFWFCFSISLQQFISSSVSYSSCFQWLFSSHSFLSFFSVGSSFYDLSTFPLCPSISCLEHYLWFDAWNCNDHVMLLTMLIVLSLPLSSCVSHYLLT